jgi:hypothetical protein
MSGTTERSAAEIVGLGPGLTEMIKQSVDDSHLANQAVRIQGDGVVNLRYQGVDFDRTGDDDVSNDEYQDKTNSLAEIHSVRTLNNNESSDIESLSTSVSVRTTELLRQLEDALGITDEPEGTREKSLAHEGGEGVDAHTVGTDPEVRFAAQDLGDYGHDEALIASAASSACSVTSSSASVAPEEEEDALTDPTSGYGDAAVPEAQQDARGVMDETIADDSLERIRLERLERLESQMGKLMLVFEFLQLKDSDPGISQQEGEGGTQADGVIGGSVNMEGSDVGKSDNIVDETMYTSPDIQSVVDDAPRSAADIADIADSYTADNIPHATNHAVIPHRRPSHQGKHYVESLLNMAAAARSPCVAAVSLIA